MREKQEKLAFLFGVDDHWAPLQMFEEVCDGFHMLYINMYIKGFIVFLKSVKGISVKYVQCSCGTHVFEFVSWKTCSTVAL